MNALGESASHQTMHFLDQMTDLNVDPLSFGPFGERQKLTNHASASLSVCFNQIYGITAVWILHSQQLYADEDGCKCVVQIMCYTPREGTETRCTLPAKEVIFGVFSLRAIQMVSQHANWFAVRIQKYESVGMNPTVGAVLVPETKIYRVSLSRILLKGCQLRENAMAIVRVHLLEPHRVFVGKFMVFITDLPLPFG